jgi:hypothetical protein
MPAESSHAAGVVREQHVPAFARRNDHDSFANALGEFARNLRNEARSPFALRLPLRGGLKVRHCHLPTTFHRAQQHPASVRSGPGIAGVIAGISPFRSPLPRPMSCSRRPTCQSGKRPANRLGGSVRPGWLADERCSSPRALVGLEPRLPRQSSISRPPASPLFPTLDPPKWRTCITVPFRSTAASRARLSWLGIARWGSCGVRSS